MVHFAAGNFNKIVAHAFARGTDEAFLIVII
jgi:hypothetical protein